MDPLQKATMFAGLTDREIAEAVVSEMGRRKLLGCIFIFPNTGGASAFASSTPPDSISDLSAAEQLLIFAEVAAQAVTERRTPLLDYGVDETRKPN